MSHLDKMTPEEVVNLELPTGAPLVYELDENLTPIKHYYIGDMEKINKKIAKYKEQTKA